VSADRAMQPGQGAGKLVGQALGVVHKHRVSPKQS
jgi:hypothetical protein